jgi:hypothetical protein
MITDAFSPVGTSDSRRRDALHEELICRVPAGIRMQNRLETTSRLEAEATSADPK